MRRSFELMFLAAVLVVASGLNRAVSSVAAEDATIVDREAAPEETVDASAQLAGMPRVVPDDLTVTDPDLARLVHDIQTGRATLPQLRAFHDAWFLNFPFDRTPPADLRARLLREVESYPSITTVGRSRVGGTGWANIGPSNYSGRTTAIATHPTDPDIAYVGSAGGGVWRWQWSDGGLRTYGSPSYTWTPLFDGQPTLSIGAIALDPTDPLRIYVGTGEMNNAFDSYQGMGVIRSFDGGASWMAPVSIDGAGRIAALAIRPDQTTTLFAATDRGVYRSLDSGASWHAVLPMLPATGRTQSLAIDPVNSDRVFVGTAGDVGVAGVQLSTAGGGPGSFTLLSGGLPSVAMDRVELAIAPSDPDVIYAALSIGNGEMWKSIDGGSSWFQLPTPTASICVFCGDNCAYNLTVAVDPTDPLRVVAGGTCLFTSPDGGASWAWRAAAPASHHDVGFLAGSPLALDANDSGLYRWNVQIEDGYAVSRGFTTLQLNSIAHDPVSHSDVFAGARNNHGHRLPLSRAESIEFYPFGCRDGGQMRVNPTSGRLYATSCPQSGRLNVSASDHQGGMMVWIVSGIDPAEGSSWVPPLELANDTTLYTATRDRVYRTTNADAPTIANITWTPLGVADLTPAPANGWISTVGSTPLESNVLFAGTSSGLVWVSQDGGANWTERWLASGGRPRAIGRVVASPTQPGRAWITLGGFADDDFDSGDHIYTTTDYGLTWAPFTTSLPDIPVHTLVPDNLDPNHFWAGTWLGLFKTEDAGVSWSRHTAVPALPVVDLALDPIDNDLFAATYGRGIYKLEDEPPPADLVLTKTRLGSPTTAPRSPVRFQIDLENVGLGALDSASLGDTLPGCFEPIGVAGASCPTGPDAPSVTCSGTACAGVTCTIATDGLGFIYEGIDLTASDGGPGGRDEIHVDVVVFASTPTGPCTNLAAIDDPTDGLIQATADVTIVANPTADLDIRKIRTSPSPAPLGTGVSFDIELTNVGLAAVSGISVGDTVPTCLQPLGVAGNPCPTGPCRPSVRCIGPACSAATCTLTNGGFGFVLAGVDLAALDFTAGGADELTIEVDTEAGYSPGLCTNVAAVQDPHDGLITSTAAVALEGTTTLADLVLSSEALRPTTVNPGDPVTFDLHLDNQGGGVLNGGALGNTLPTCLNPLGVDGSQCPNGPSAPSVTCTGSAASCASAVCTISNGGHGFEYSNINLGDDDGCPGGGDEITFTVRATAGSSLGPCDNVAAIQDPTDGLILTTLAFRVVRPFTLYWSNAQSGANAVWRVTPQLAFKDGSYLPFIADLAWRSRAVGDLDSNGVPELLWRHATTGSNVAWTIDNGTLVGTATLPPVFDPAALLSASADVNRDGYDDILWRHAVTGDNSIWFMQSNIPIGSGLLPRVADLTWTLVGAGHFNGDSQVDLLWWNSANGHVAVWFMDGALILNGVYIAVVDMSWRAVGVADADADGDADIIWRHASGANAIWVMNGITFDRGVSLPPASGDWYLGGAR